jgi:hypothetical protein
MSPFEIVAGLLTFWLAPEGTAFPLATVAPPGPWFRLGTNGDANYEDDGITVANPQKIESFRSAGRTGVSKVFRTEEDFIMGLKLADMSLEQFTYVMNGNTVTTTAAGVSIPGVKKMGLYKGQNVATYALLARGLVSPYGDNFVSQIELPRVYQSANPKPVFKKGKPAMLDVEFTALEDMNATAPEFRFGRITSQHQVPL